MTYGELHEPFGHPRIEEFHERTPVVFEVAAGTPGHIATAGRARAASGRSGDRQDDGAWGSYRTPSYHPGSLDPDTRTDAQTLTLWRDLESVYGFAYSGPHLEAMRKRKSWFKPRIGPTYVAWWVTDDHTPSWDEACTRIEHLHEHGPTPYAFDFRTPFDADGRPVSLERRP